MFFTCSDDPSNLYLSTDADPANKKLIAQETGWSDSRTYTTVGNHPARLTTQPTAPPSIGIASSGGKVVLTFTGILQSSSTVDGHYADVPDAGSPFEVPAGPGTGLFYRSSR